MGNTAPFCDYCPKTYCKRIRFDRPANDDNSDDSHIECVVKDEPSRQFYWYNTCCKNLVFFIPIFLDRYRINQSHPQRLQRKYKFRVLLEIKIFF